MDLRELPKTAFARHPWESVRADFFARLLREQVWGHGLSALDMGAGDGYFAGRLLAQVPSIARITCFDSAYGEAWLRDKAAGPPALSFTAVRPTSRFDVVVLLDVLEHVADDLATLREAAALLKPSGRILLSAPAYPVLFSRHDVLLGHKRRYAPARMRSLAREAGLAILAQGQLFASLILARALAKLGEIVSGHQARDVADPPAQVETALGTWKHGSTVTRTVTAALALDAFCSRSLAKHHLSCPGLSTWVLAQPSAQTS